MTVREGEGMRRDERPKGPRIEPWVVIPIVIAVVALAWMAIALLRR
jgi:hypothetical protein